MAVELRELAYRMEEKGINPRIPDFIRGCARIVRFFKFSSF